MPQVAGDHPVRHRLEQRAVQVQQHQPAAAAGPGGDVLPHAAFELLGFAGAGGAGHVQVHGPLGAGEAQWTAFVAIDVTENQVVAVEHDGNLQRR